MHDRIEIVDTPDPLTRKVWTFWFSDRYGLVLDTYEVETRKTTRHKFHVEKCHNRLSTRDSNLREAEVPMTEEIKARAMDALLARVRAMGVHLWSEVEH